MPLYSFSLFSLFFFCIASLLFFLQLISFFSFLLSYLLFYSSLSLLHLFLLLSFSYFLILPHSLFFSGDFLFLFLTLIIFFLSSHNPFSFIWSSYILFSYSISPSTFIILCGVFVYFAVVGDNYFLLVLFFFLFCLFC